MTVAAYEQGTNFLAKHFSKIRPLNTIGTVEADEFTAAVRNSGIAPATQSKRLQVVKRIFSRCKRWKWIPENPFEHIRPGGQANPERVLFIPSSDIIKIMSATTDIEWHAILALARFGGLQCPSEVLALKWEHVNFDEGSLHLPSPKTAKAGKPFRVMPIFHELRPYLEALHGVKDPENEHVITRYRVTNANLRTQFERLAQKVGVKTWPKPFQNMRASRATEVERIFGPKAEVQWLGHTEKVALAHYLTVTEGDFARASQEPTSLPIRWGQKWGQTAKDTAGQAGTGERENRVLGVENAVSSDSEATTKDSEWARQDLNYSQIPADSEDSVSKGPERGLLANDSSILIVTKAWEKLSPNVRAHIISLVRCSHPSRCSR